MGLNRQRLMGKSENKLMGVSLTFDLNREIDTALDEFIPNHTLMHEKVMVHHTNFSEQK